MKTFAPLLLLPLCATALVNAQPMEIIEIEGRIDETLSLKQAENGVAMVTIGREQIDQAGTADLNGILQQFVPELTAISKNGRYDYASYSLQGSRSQDILWLIDGIRINNLLFGGGYLDSISTAMIDRIEVLQAGQGVMYGTDALAGVVNIITRSYKGTDEGQIGVGIDTLGSTQLHGYASSQVGEIELTVFGASDQSDGYSPWKDSDYHWTATDRERGYDVQNLGAKVGWKTNDTAVSLMAQYNQADLDYMRSYFNVETQNRREQTLLTLSVDSQLTDTTQAIVKAYHHRWDTDYFRLYQYEDGSIDLRNNNDYWGFEDTGVKAWFEGSAGQHFWSLGAEYQQYKGSDVTMGFETDTERVTDVFGQFKPRFESTPQLKSAVGVRYSTISDGEDALVGELSAKYAINSDWKLLLSGGNSFRLPTAEHLYATEDTMGNRDLTPEKGQNINTGFQYSNDDIRIDTNF
jgi:outer membrane cobalamin receptor